MGQAAQAELTQFYDDFFISANAMMKEIHDDALSLEGKTGGPSTLDGLFRKFHTLKGNAAFFGFQGLKDVSHSLEDMLKAAKDGGAATDGAFLRLLWQGINLSGALLHEAQTDRTARPAGVEAQAYCTLVRESIRAAAPRPHNTRRDDTQRYMIGDSDVSRQVFVINDYLDRAAGGPVAADDSSRFLEQLGSLAAVFQTAGMTEAALSARRAMSDFETLSADGALDPASVPVVRESLFPAMHSVRTVACRQAAEQREKNLHVEERRIDELITGVRRLESLAERMLKVRENISQSDLPMDVKLEMNASINSLNSLHRDIFQMLVRIKLVEPGQFLEKCKKIIESIAVSCGKRVRVETDHGSVLVERANIEFLEEVFIHLARNAVDHGIETPDERSSAGKPQEGCIRIIMRDEKDSFLVSVSDDGRGMDFAGLRQAAYEKGFITGEELALGDSLDPARFLFQAGVSSRKEAGEFSGRGIGLNAIYWRVTGAGGNIRVVSRPGEGTRFELSLPSHLKER